MKKSRHRRTPAHKVSERQRAAAIAALHRTVENPNAPEYTRIKAAASLIQAARIDEDAAPERDPDAPRKYVILPDNGRNPNVRYGLFAEGQGVVIVPRGYPYPEIQPEEFYKDAPKPADLLAEKRPKMLLAPELIAP